MKQVLLTLILVMTGLFSNDLNYKPIFNIGNKIVEETNIDLVYSLSNNTTNIKYKTYTKNTFFVLDNNKWPLIDVIIDIFNEANKKKSITYALILENYKSTFIVGSIKNIKVNKKTNKRLQRFNNKMYLYDGLKIHEVEMINGNLSYANQERYEEESLTTMSISDFIIDYSSLNDLYICVKGNIFAMVDIISLADINNPMSQVFLNINGLPKEFRKKIITYCNGINECIQTVCGLTQEINFNKGIKVSNID